MCSLFPLQILNVSAIKTERTTRGKWRKWRKTSDASGRCVGLMGTSAEGLQSAERSKSTCRLQGATGHRVQLSFGQYLRLGSCSM